MKEGLIKDSYELIIKELQSVVTIVYLLMVGMGMLFEHHKFSEFGINIFQYADVFDFLIAPFEDYFIILFTLLSVSFSFFLFRLDLWYSRKIPRIYHFLSWGMSRKSWYNTYKYIAFSVILVMYIFFAAGFYGRMKRAEITNETRYRITYSDNRSIEGNVIGKTNEVVFLWVENKVKIIPISDSIREMEVLK